MGLKPNIGAAGIGKYAPVLLILAALAGYQFAHYHAINLILVCASIGLCAFAFSLISFKKEVLSRGEIIILAIVFLFLASSLWSYSLNPTELAKYRVKRFAMLALCGIGPLLFIQQFIPGGINIRHFSVALVISTVITGPAALYIYYFVDDDWRVSLGPNYPTIFGDIVSLNALLCFYLALNERKSQILRLALCTGVVCALMGAYASGSRGAWLGLVVVAPIIVTTQTRTSIKAKMVMLLLLCTGILIAFYANNTISMRIGLLPEEIEDYFLYHNALSSNGLRIEFWKASLLTLQQSPWLGVGDQELGSAFAGLIEQGQVSPAVASFVHVHNDLLQLAYSKGIPGVILYFALIAMPLMVAPPRWRKPALIVSFSYLVFGLTDSLFIIEMSVAYYFFLTVLIMNLSLEPSLPTPLSPQ